MPKAIYVDVDDTLVRSFGSKRIPMGSVIDEVRRLHAAGNQMYLWSTAGSEYCRATAIELGIEGCFLAFLTKPNAYIDDQRFVDWRDVQYFHPNQANQA
jgi:hypothetical protein